MSVNLNTKRGSLSWRSSKPLTKLFESKITSQVSLSRFTSIQQSFMSNITILRTLDTLLILVITIDRSSPIMLQGLIQSLMSKMVLLNQEKHTEKNWGWKDRRREMQLQANSKAHGLYMKDKNSLRLSRLNSLRSRRRWCRGTRKWGRKD